MSKVQVHPKSFSEKYDSRAVFLINYFCYRTLCMVLSKARTIYNKNNPNFTKNLLYTNILAQFVNSLSFLTNHYTEELI